MNWHKAAVEALRNSSVVVFCVDVSKTDWADDVSIRELIKPKALIPVATKCDLLSKEMVANRIAELNKLFNVEFLPTSAETGLGMEQLCDTIDEKLIEQTLSGNRNGLASGHQVLRSPPGTNRQSARRLRMSAKPLMN